MAKAIKVIQRIYPPVEHHDYGELDVYCCCDLCNDWRQKLQCLQGFQVNLPKKDCVEESCHPDLKGPCAECRLALRQRMIYLAALNRRDLYSECSYHASRMDPEIVGESFMVYITKIVKDRKTRADGWWTNKAPYLPLQFWITMFKQSTIADVDVLEEVERATATLPKGYLSVAAVSGL